jgi:hypothetical protein
MGLGFGIWDYGILPIPTIWAASIDGAMNLYGMHDNGKTNTIIHTTLKNYL